MPSNARSNRNPLTSKLTTVQRFAYLLPLFAWASFACGQPPGEYAAGQAPDESQALVDRALANELKAAKETSHPMRYQLRKTSPRLTTTKEIYETKDGEVARLLEVNDQPLSAEDEEKEQTRLNDLLADPGKQRHRKQAEDTDAGRALMILRELPNAFLYQFAGSTDGPQGKLEKFTFRPNPNFSPPNLETEVLTQMTGEISIDPTRGRVTHLEGHLQQDVDVLWGVVGRLSKGGWIAIDQADIGDGQWHLVRFQMQMSGRVFWKTRIYDTTEVESKFVPLPAGTSYQKAIEMTREDPK